MLILPPPHKNILDQTHIFLFLFETDNLFSIAFHPEIFQTNLLATFADVYNHV